MKNQLLTLEVLPDAVHIYREVGYTEPAYVASWHRDEWNDDEDVMAAIENAIYLFHTDQKELLMATNNEYLILTPDSLEIKARTAFQSELGMQLDELYLTSDGMAFVREREATNHQQANRDKCNACIYLYLRHETLIDGVFMEGDVVCLKDKPKTYMVISGLHGKTAYCSYVTNNNDSTEYFDAIMEVSVDRLEHYRA